jgi:hypothetical protein
MIGPMSWLKVTESFVAAFSTKGKANVEMNRTLLLMEASLSSAKWDGEQIWLRFGRICSS